MKIYSGSDHGGYLLKQYLIENLRLKGYNIEDCGCDSQESVGFPNYAEVVCKNVLNKEKAYGILVCGTGIRMSIAANKYPGIHASLLSDTFSAQLTKEHNDSNVMCLGQRVIGNDLALLSTETWLESEFQHGKYKRRVEMVDNIKYKLDKE